MNKVKDLAKKHKKAIIITASVAGGLLVGGVAVYLNRAKLAELINCKEIADFVATKRSELPNSDLNLLELSKNKDGFQLTDKVGGIHLLNNGEPFPVKGHARNLPAGQNASAEKIEAAIRIGIVLEENQTYVEDYIKNCA